MRARIAALTIAVASMACLPASGPAYREPPAGSFTMVERTSMSGAGGDALTGAEVAPGFFGATGASPLLGRTFTAADHATGSPPVLLLHHDLWQRAFGGTPEVVGRPVTVGGREMTIVGVMPSGFDIPERARFWVPRGAR